MRRKYSLSYTVQAVFSVPLGREPNPRLSNGVPGNALFGGEGVWTGFFFCVRIEAISAITRAWDRFSARYLEIAFHIYGSLEVCSRG